MKKRTFTGSIPDETWEYVGIVSSGVCRFLIYSKKTINRDGEFTGYKYLKVVLEPGKKLPKGNYWLSVRISDGYLVRNSDLKKMSDNVPVLYKNIIAYLDDLFS